MRIGDLAKLTGVSASTIRFYEIQGLLPAAARLANGYRDYDRHAVEIVKFIDRARNLGFGLREVAAHLRLPRGEAASSAWGQTVRARCSHSAGASPSRHDLRPCRRGAEITDA
jgi:DNA-binding transcriptional MerR regulator